jgi:hypothetical protein
MAAISAEIPPAGQTVPLQFSDRIILGMTGWGDGGTTVETDDAMSAQAIPAG